MHRTSRLLIASTGVDSEWAHTKAATEANPAVAHLNADLWYRWCLLPEGHEFLYQTPALCSNASYSQANVPVTIVLSSKVNNCTLSAEEDEDTVFFAQFSRFVLSIASDHDYMDAVEFGLYPRATDQPSWHRKSCFA